MIPILYDNSETAFRSNGIGRLRDCVKCIVTEARNGIYECEFDYPITGVHYSDIREGMIVACTHDQTGDIQPFEIYRRKEPIDGIVTFYAHHISYRLLNVILRPFTAEGITAALAGFKTNSVNDNPFTFWTDKTTQGTYTIKQPSSLREMLAGTSGSLLDVFGTGDYEFDRFTVRLWADRGADNGVTIRYGKNLADIERNNDLSGTYNAVAPYWTDQDLENVVTLPEIIVTSPTLINIASEPWTDDASQQMTDENGVPFWFDYAPIKAVPLDMTADFDNEPTPDQMRQKALAKMASGRHWLPSTNIDVDFVALEDTPEYADVAPLQRVSLCDTVRVIYPGVGLDVKEKVIKTDYNVLLNAYDRVELGNPTSSLSDVITAQTEGKIAKDYPTKGFLENALDNATQLITGGLGGHVVFNLNANGEPQEILVMDTDDKTTAVNVIRINKNGIGFSNTGYEGPFSSAWTIDNTLDMSQINVANMNANAITAGTLQSQDGGNSWNLENGIIQTKSGSSVTQIDGGRVSFLLDVGGANVPTASIRPIAWGDDYETGRGVMIGAQNGATYVALAHNSGGGFVADLIVNNGLNPNGNEQRLQLIGSTLITGTLDVNSGCSFSGTLAVDSYCYFNRQINVYTGIRLRATGPTDSQHDAFVSVATDLGYSFGPGALLLLTYGSQTFTYVGKLSGYTSTVYNTAVANSAEMYVDGNSYINGFAIASKGVKFATDAYVNYNATKGYVYASKNVYTSGNSHTTGNGYFGGLVGACQTVSESGYDTVENKYIYFYYNASGYAGIVVKNGSYAQDLIQYSGSDNKVYYRFASNVFISYDDSNDYIYSSKTIHQPSDERLKDIRPYDERYDALVDRLEPFVYKWKDRPDGPDRVGLGARKTRQALLDLGLDDSGFVCVYTDETGNEQYSVDYQELSVMLLHAYQKQKMELDDLKAKVHMIMDRLEV